MNLNLIVLRTPNLLGLKDFYSTMGIQFNVERHGNGPEHFAAALEGGLILELYPILDGTSPDSGLRLGFAVDDVGETLQRIGQQATPKQSPWGLRALVRDPDGRTIELLQSAS